MPLFNPMPLIATDVKARNLAGFANGNADTTITWDNANLIVSIAKTGASFTVYTNNNAWVKTTTQTATITNTVAQWFIYFDATGTLVASTQPWDITSDQVASAAGIYWDGTNGAVSDERHSAQRDRWNHRNLHDTRGAAYETGLTGTFTNTTLSVVAGTIFDEDIEFNIGTTQTTARVYYRATGGTAMKFEDLTTPYKATAGTLQYDNGGTLTSVSTANGGWYVVNWVYTTTDITRPIYVVVGQAQYQTTTTARLANVPTIPNIETREWKLIYRIIYRNISGTATYIESADYRTVSTLPGAVVTSLPAAAVTFTPIEGIAATNVQTAFAQVAPLTSGIADGATAVGVAFNTAVAYSTTGAKLLSVQNNSVEKAYFDLGGDLFINTVRFGSGPGAVTTNVVAGAGALAANTTGNNNVAIGSAALSGGLTSTYNIAIGTNALAAANANNYGIAIGKGTLSQANGSTENIAIGTDALGTQQAGNNNVAIGKNALKQATSANHNIAIGVEAGHYINNGNYHNQGSYSIYIGDSVRASADSIANEIAIGYDARGGGANTIMLGDSTITKLFTYGAITSPIANGSGAVGTVIDTNVAFSTAGTKLLSVRNNTVEKAYIDKDGNVAALSIKPITATSSILRGAFADGATAIGAIIDNSVTLSTTGAKLLSVQNNSVEKMAVDPNGLITSGGSPVSRSVVVPANAGSAGSVGDWAADASYLYICTAASTWQRTAITLATW